MGKLTETKGNGHKDERKRLKANDKETWERDRRMRKAREREREGGKNGTMRS